MVVCSTMRPMRILVADDHALFRDGIRLLLKNIENIVLSEACNRDEINQQLNKTPLPDILLLDLAMPGVESVQAVKDICQTHPQVAVMILSGNDSEHIVHACLSAGALGFLPKSSPTEVMLNAIHSVYAGEIYTPLPTPSNIPQTIALSPRQKEVFTLIATGESNKQISHALNISESTVKQHVSEVYRKLDVSSRTQAIQKANHIHISIL